MKIASVVKDMNTSQNVFYMTKCFNYMIHDDIAPMCFYLNLGAVTIWPQFSYMNIYYSSSFFNGIMIATCLDTARIISKLNNSCEKYLYLWDLEWLNEPRDYIETVELLSKFTLISRSELHQKNILNYCNKNSLIIEDWDYKQIKQLVEDYARKTNEKRV